MQLLGEYHTTGLALPTPAESQCLHAHTLFKRPLWACCLLFCVRTVYAGNASVKAAQRPSDYDVLMSQATRNELAEVVYQTGRLAMGERHTHTHTHTHTHAHIRTHTAVQPHTAMCSSQAKVTALVPAL